MDEKLPALWEHSVVRGNESTSSWQCKQLYTLLWDTEGREGQSLPEEGGILNQAEVRNTILTK